MKKIILFVLFPILLLAQDFESKVPIRLKLNDGILTSFIYSNYYYSQIGTQQSPFFTAYINQIYTNQIGDSSFVTPFIFLKPMRLSQIGDVNDRVFEIYSTLNDASYLRADTISYIDKDLASMFYNNLDKVRTQLASLNKPLIKIAGYGDSIMGNTVSDTRSGASYTLPPKLYYTNFTSFIYDSLSLSKPTFRQLSHADWTKTGTWTMYTPIVPPNYTDVNDKYGESEINGSSASITITGQSYVEFLFESIGSTMFTTTNSALINGSSGVGTGVAIITVSVDGGGYVTPSTVLKDISSDTTYGKTVAGIDTLDTNFSSISPYQSTDYQANPCLLLGYQLDSAHSYTFKITWDSLATSKVGYPLRLWGAFYWSGKAVWVYNVANPGDNWQSLNLRSYGAIAKPRWDLVLMESVWYHNLDFTTSELTKQTKLFCDRMGQYSKDYGITTVMMSTPPGGVAPTGSWNGSSWDYTPGVNVFTASTKSVFDYGNKITKRYSAANELAYIDIYKLYDKYVNSLGDSLLSVGWTVDTTTAFYNTWRGLGTVHGYNYQTVKANVMSRFVSNTDGHHPSTEGDRKWASFVYDALFKNIYWK